jgi:hypothetical protein
MKCSDEDSSKLRDRNGSAVSQLRQYTEIADLSIVRRIKRLQFFFLVLHEGEIFTHLSYYLLERNFEIRVFMLTKKPESAAGEEKENKSSQIRVHFL